MSKQKKVNTDKQAKALYEKTINANKQRIRILNMLYSNEWNLVVSIYSDLDIPAVTIKERLQDTLKSNGFPASSYKMLVTARPHGIYGYVEVLPDANGYTPIIEFIEATYSMTGSYNITCRQLADAESIMDITNNNKYTKVLKTNNVGTSNISIEHSVCVFIDEFMKKRSANKNYAQNYELKGSMKNKSVEFYPQINSQGNGYVWVYINEYKKNTLKHQCFGAVIIRNRKPYPISKNELVYFLSLTGKCHFVYVIFKKPNWDVVYIGTTRTIETRPKRHFSPTESYSNNTSVPFNYDFWLKYGNLPVNEDNKELFKKHKLSYDEYEIRFLPLPYYNHYVKMDSAHKKTLLPEAYIMDALQKEVPNKIVYSDANMTFFCNKIIHKNHGAPLWFSSVDINDKQGCHNSSRHQVERLLRENSHIINGIYDFNTGFQCKTLQVNFESLLRTGLQLVTGENIKDLGWYEIFKDHALTLEQAVHFAVGSSHANKEHKEAIVQHILKTANYPINEVDNNE